MPSRESDIVYLRAGTAAVLVLLLATAIASGNSSAGSEAGSSTYVNDLEIVYDSTVVDVDVSPDGDGIAIFTGEVTARNIPDIWIDVDINGDGAAMLRFHKWEDGDTKTFSLIYTVPLMTPQSARQVQVIPAVYSSTGQKEPLPRPEQVLIVNVLPYYNISLAGTYDTTVGVKDDIDIDLVIENLGNTADRFSISVQNAGALSDSGWTFDPIGTTTLHSGENRTIGISGRAPDEPGRWEVFITIISEFSVASGDEIVLETLVLTIEVEGSVWETVRQVPNIAFIVLAFSMVIVAWRWKVVHNKTV